MPIRWLTRSAGMAAATLTIALVATEDCAAQAASAADSVLLDSLRQTALTVSPLLAVHRAELSAAEARVAAAGLLPPVVLSGEIDEAPGFDPGAASLRVEVSRELRSGARRRAAREVAFARVDAARIALQTSERVIAARLAAALSSATAAGAVARRFAAEDSLLAAAEDALRGRFALGEARYVDVLRLRTERLRVQTERARALAEARAGHAALIALAAPFGEPAGALLVDSLLERAARGGLVFLPQAPPPLDSLLFASGAVQLAELAVRRARAERRLVAAEQRTRIEASVGFQRFGELERRASFGPVLGASITLPFTGPRRQEVLVAERELQAAEAARVATIAQVRALLTEALARYDAARERLATFDAGVLRGAREERESALASYRTGDLSLIELLDFERALARAEVERLRALSEAAGALTELQTAAAGEISLLHAPLLDGER